MRHSETIMSGHHRGDAERYLMLNFPTKWRVTPPPDGELFTATIPQEACEEFLGLAQSVAANATERKRAFEEFKRGFAQARGVGFYPSSSADYAEYDLRESMKESCANAPKF